MMTEFGSCRRDEKRTSIRIEVGHPSNRSEVVETVFSALRSVASKPPEPLGSGDSFLRCESIKLHGVHLYEGMG